MSLNTEQTTKLRTLVKNKLVELGEYVDDQLTDYVIIMVTNRKSERQMAEDLELFLGGIDNSTKFSAWLHQMIKNLNTESTAQQVGTYKKQNSKTRHTTTNQAELDELAIQIETNEFNEDIHQQQQQHQQTGMISQTHQIEQQTSHMSAKHHNHHQVPKFNSTPLIIKPITSCIGAVINHDQHEDAVDEPNDELNSMSRRATTRRRSTASPTRRSRSRSRDNAATIQDRLHRRGGSAKSSLNIMLKAVDDANKSVSMTSSTAAKRSIADEKLEEIRAKRRKAVAEQVVTLDPSLGKRLSYPEENRPKRLRTNTSRPLTESKSTSGSGDKRQVVRLVERKDASATTATSTAHHEKTISKLGDGSGGGEDDDDDDDEDGAGIRIELNRNSSNKFQQRDINSTEQQQQQQQQQQLQNTAASSSTDKDIKFIVTLSGVDEAQFKAASSSASRRGLFGGDDINDDELIYEGEAGYDDDFDMADETSNQFNSNYRMQNQMGGDDEMMDQDNAALGSASSIRQQHSKKKLIRCTFWPNCERGEQCPYLHPSKPCTAFPNCPFGAKCHYVHPPCRYDGFCARLDCPYTHYVNTKKSTPATEPSAPGPTPATTADATTVPSTTTAAAAAAAAATSAAPKITINKIQQPYYSLVNVATPIQPTAQPTQQQQPPPSTGTSLAIPQQDTQTAPTATTPVRPTYYSKSIQPAFMGTTATAKLPNQYMLINRTNTVGTIPIYCKYGNLCKNPKCLYTHNVLPQKSQLKWVAPSSQTSTTPTKTTATNQEQPMVAQATANCQAIENMQ